MQKNEKDRVKAGKRIVIKERESRFLANKAKKREREESEKKYHIKHKFWLHQ